MIIFKECVMGADVFGFISGAAFMVMILLIHKMLRLYWGDSIGDF